MNMLPLGVTASCENCGYNMRNNIFNDQEDPVCTYRMRGIDDAKEREDREEMNRIFDNARISQCTPCEGHFVYETYIPKMTYLSSMEDLKELYLRYEMGAYSISDCFTSKRHTCTHKHSVMIEVLDYAGDEFHSKLGELCGEDDYEVDDTDALEKLFDEYIVSLDHEYPAVAFLWDENSYSRAGDTGINVFIVKSINDMANYRENV